MDKALERYEKSNKQITKDSAAYTDLLAAYIESKKQYVLLAFEFVRRALTLKAFINSVISESVIQCLIGINTHYQESQTLVTELIIKTKGLNLHEHSKVDINECTKWQDEYVSRLTYAGLLFHY